jgi:uncharacterized protein YjbI with pentapeptide repeats
MKDLRPQNRGAWGLICLSLLVASMCIRQEVASAQDNTNNSPKTEQQKLTDAQTRYYEAQAAKLDQERSPSQRIINLSAFLAALVAVLSLVLNYSSTLRTQRDSQFLEALKRFGDKDSPSVRASAAGLLAKLGGQRGILFKWRRPNFDIVFDQLMAGLRLEENSVCVSSIIDAVRHLTKSRPLLVLQRIAAANLRVQKDLVQALAKFLATMTTDESNALSMGNHWSAAASSTPYSEHALRTLALRQVDEFLRACRSAIQEYKLVSAESKRAMRPQTQRELSLIANRLSLNVQLCIELLRSLRNLASREKSAISNIDLRSVFLVNADLSFADLKEINLESAQLQGADLHFSTLQEANFEKANLQGADLSKANLQRADFFEARLEGASLDEANLQQALLRSAQLRSLELPKPDGRVEIKKTSLRKTNLEGANLRFADLRGSFVVGANFKGAQLGNARLHGTVVENKNPYLDENTSLENSDWWAANFLDGDKFGEGDSDDSLLEFLFSRYGREVPDKRLDWSVQQFLKTHPQK